jgi:hypothetical protein
MNGGGVDFRHMPTIGLEELLLDPGHQGNLTDGFERGRLGYLEI